MSPLTSTDALAGDAAGAGGPNDAAAHWADISAAMAAFAAQGASGDVTATLVGAGACARAESFIAWLRYARSAELFDAVLQAKLDDGDDELDLFDAHTQTAARLAMSLAISQSWAENLLSQGLALRDRLPKVAECLRDGLITPAQGRQIISRTELVDGTDHAAPVDAAIAVALRAKPGSWTVNGIRNLADRVVFRHHPDAVREARERSLANRTTWVTPAPSGMATVGASMTAENARLAHRAVTALAATACEHDTRSVTARTSDAFYSLLAGEAFTCDCGHEDCAAEIPVAGQLASDANGRIVVHVVCDESTAAGNSEHLGFLADHGIISPNHVRDIIDRPDSLVRPLAPQASDPTPVSLPQYQPSDPYRPSAALDTFVRIRDGYCTAPGCDRPAFTAEVDHVVEYDHHDPEAGGPTHPDWLNAKCKFHHLLKTFGDWTDDQHIDTDGHTRTTWITPERIAIAGAAENNQDVFPGLGRYRWHAPEVLGTAVDSRSESTAPKPRRVKTRTQRKHERRRAERARNRRMREHLDAIRRARVAGEPPPLQPGDPPY